jgi:hypothetical protein
MPALSISLFVRLGIVLCAVCCLGEILEYDVRTSFAMHAFGLAILERSGRRFTFTDLGLSGLILHIVTLVYRLLRRVTIPQLIGLSTEVSSYLLHHCSHTDCT